jgi:methyltransferase (TIGR00027 family)
MSEKTAVIQDVSDTALWVAYYRAVETERPDALFQDRLAKLLVGDRGREIAESMKATSRYTQWSVVIRTRIIDKFIQDLVQEGVDTVINLGAGLDTRPYRLQLSKPVRWVEVDYPHIITHKETTLKDHTPTVNLERIALDLANRGLRKELFQKLGAESKRALIITEGVILYLTVPQVAELAEDLRSEKSFKYWIAEYVSPRLYRYFKTRTQRQNLKNAPFQFFPEDWFGLFRQKGWTQDRIRYITEESIKLNRVPPFPWWARLLQFLIPKNAAKKMQQEIGYVVFI